MACHQSHNIPWSTLASHFRYSPCIRCYDGRADLVPKFKESQGKEIHYFLGALAKTIAAHAVDELARHPERVEPLQPEATILSSNVVKRITPSLLHITKDLTIHGYSASAPEELGRLHSKLTKTNAYLHARAHSPWNAWDGPEAFASIEIFKLLIIYGEMDTLQHICQHPQAAWTECWDRHRDSFGDQNTCGWAFVPRLALKAYLGLNLILCFPALWDNGSGRSGESDYRRTACYQRTVRDCTKAELSHNIAALPHRQFFGVPEKQFGWYAISRQDRKHAYLFDKDVVKGGYPYGVLPYMDFLGLETEVVHMPSVSDVMHVRWCLCSLALPMELVTEIMDLAGYRPARRLQVPHDPLHPANRKELRRYLNFCFRILVRCDVISRWLDGEIPWDRLAAEALVDLLGDGESRHTAKHGRRFFERTYPVPEREGFTTLDVHDITFL